MDPADSERTDIRAGAPDSIHEFPNTNAPLLEELRWLRSVVRNSLEIVKIVDTDGTLRYANPAFGRVLGYDPEEILGSNVLDYVHPDDLPRVAKETEKALAQGGVVRNVLEYRFKHRDGSWRWMESSGTYLLDDPSVGGVVVNARDVTERREAEQRLREAEQRYRNLVERIPASAYVDPADGSNLSIYTSPQIEVITGYSVAEWMATDLWSERLHPEDRDRVLSCDDLAKATGEPFSEEYRLIAKDGRVVWVRDEAALLRDEAGNPMVWQGVLVDVTERREAEEALRRSDVRFRTLTQNASDLVTILDADGNILYQSPSIERILGYSSDEMLGDNAFDFIHPKDVRGVRGRFLRGIAEPDLLPTVEYRFRRKDGSWRWLESVGSNLLEDPRVGGYVVNSRDVTERKEAEEALKRSEERYRTVVEQQTELVCRFLPDMTLTFVNDAYCRFFEQDPEVLIGSSFMDHIPEEDRPHYLRQLSRLDRKEPSGTIEHRVFAPSGEIRWQQWTDRAIFDDDGQIAEYQSVGRDISERKVLEQRLEHRALHDPLTDLPNRRLFVDRLGQALRLMRRRQPGRKVAVLFMDLDGFKVINDSLGHEMGDKLLLAVSERLRGCLRPEDTLARFGGDEFVVLLEDVEGPEEAARVAERITETLKGTYLLEGKHLSASASIGIALGDVQQKTSEDLLRDADTAMYRAKEEGQDYSLFDPVLYERAVARLELENALRRAVEREEFVLHYQPIVQLDDGEVWGLEALVRWDHPDRGLLNPDEFVPVAEESGLVVPMGERVLMEACAKATVWQKARPHTPLVISVNVSAKQLGRPDLVDTVEAVLRETGLAGSDLLLDVTETVYVNALKVNTAVLNRLGAAGVEICVDDFGMGYSSLSYLKRLPAAILKIDKSFVAGLGEDVEDTAIVRTIIDLAHTLGMRVIAEGVETWTQAVLLSELGCDLGQGYYFSRPLPPEGVAGFLAE